MLYGWKENSMLTNCYAACAHLTITVSEIQRYICEKNRHFIILPLHSTPPLGGFRRNIGTPFGTEKLEWCRYRWWKNFEDIFIRFDVIHERDGQTDRQTDTAWQQRPRLCIASRGKNCENDEAHLTHEKQFNSQFSNKYFMTYFCLLSLNTVTRVS